MKFLSAVAAGFLTLALCACERQETQPPTPQAPEREAAEPARSPAEQTDTGAAAVVAGYTIDMERGEEIYRQACATCHSEGIAGAPRTGDAEEWQPRLAKGMETLIRHSIEGYQGNMGVMPPRGGVPGLTDDEVASSVAFMVEQSR